jgi:mannose/fructose-specific phosphotransferase system component IIA
MSSASKPAVRGILLSHGGMAEGVVDAVRRITGTEEDALVPVSNHGLSPEVLADRLRSHIGAGPTILFTDLQSGSCGLVARRLAHGDDQLIVISGVNLPLLLDFVMNRTMPLDQLVPRLLDRGRAAICCSATPERNNADRPAAR